MAKRTKIEQEIEINSETEGLEELTIEDLLNEAAQGKQLNLEIAKVNADYAFRFGLDLASCTISLTEAIEEGIFGWFDAAVQQLESLGAERITLRLFSPGGCIDEACAIIGRMRNIKRIGEDGDHVLVPVDVEVYGACYSAATLILASATGERRMSEFADFMWHEGSGGTVGRESELRDYAERMSHIEARWCEWMARFTKKPKKFWLDLSKSRKDCYFSAEECRKMGVCDKVF
jgi:ATP-dependent protease ClpP protease subunit